MIHTKVPQPARQRLIDSADRLFYSQGIQATGVDQVIAEAQVAKATLYSNFPGKDALIAAYLEQRLESWIVSVRAVDDATLPTFERVDRLFALLERGVRSPDFKGCPFTNAVVERPTIATVREVVRRYRGVLTEHIATISGLKISDPRVTRLAIIYDGALAAAKSAQDWEAVEEARRFAIDVVTKGPNRPR
ncbi:MAG TPA: TetR/AcrR family transcriptional regulator [Candidatus Nanopelagicaceae bacterium]|nr:TetR/AcrR family transcriptional regulator [Candidatus Nanopelagicaceae bacterium]